MEKIENNKEANSNYVYLDDDGDDDTIRVACDSSFLFVCLFVCLFLLVCLFV